MSGSIGVEELDVGGDTDDDDANALVEYGPHNNISNKQRLFASIGLLVVIVVACGSLYLLLILFNGNHQPHTTTTTTTTQSPFTLDTLLWNMSSSRLRSVDSQWSLDGQCIYIHDEIVLSRQCANRSVHQIILSWDSISISPVLAWRVSPSTRFIVLSSKHLPIWRTSYRATYHIYDTVERTLTHVADNVEGIAFAARDDVLYYVWQNNVYSRYLASGATSQLSFDGTLDGTVTNGVMSWVYEEEVFASFWPGIWAAGEGVVAWVQFDHAGMDSFVVQKFSSVEPARPTEVRVFYPVAGAPNPKWWLVINSTETFRWTDNVADKESLLVAASWTPDGRAMIIVTSNRASTMQRRYVFVPPSTIRPLGVRESTLGWLDVPAPFVWRSATSACTIQEDFSHDVRAVACVDVNTGEEVVISRESEHVTDLYGASADGSVWYQIAPVPEDRAVMRWSDVAQASVAVSPARPGTFSLSLSRAGHYLLHNRGNGTFASLPSTTLVFGTTATVLQDNAELRLALDQLALPSRVFGTWTNPDTGVVLHYSLLLPPKWSEQRQYPVMIDVYGGPDSQNVRRLYSLGFNEMLSSAHEWVVARVDGAGTGSRGLKFARTVYQQLGRLETRDQLAFAAHLQSHSWVKSVSVFGWSYGGFMAAQMATESSARLAAVVSVAPVVDWRLYDSGWLVGWLVGWFPDHLRSLHGTLHVLARGQHWWLSQLLCLGQGCAADRAPAFLAVPWPCRCGAIGITFSFCLTYLPLPDDNVHFQNTALLDLELVTHNVPFSFMLYTNSDHSIAYHGSRAHLYTLIRDFLVRHG